MTLTTDDAATETPTGRLLVLVEAPDVARRLADWVRERDAYELVDSLPSSVARAEFDVCVFDPAGFERYDQELATARADAAPAALPCLLVVPDPEHAARPAPAWRDVEAAFDGVVDDVLTRPLRPLAVRSTIESAFRLRRRTVALERTKTRLTQFERVIDAMQHALYITRADGTIEFVNPAFTEITGYEAAEAIGTTPAILKSGTQDEQYYRDLWATVASGEVWEEAVINERKNGERYQAEQTIVPVTDDDGTIWRYVAVQTDITERANRTRHLEILDRVLRHNVSNDVNVIEGRAELIARRQTCDTVTHAEMIIEKAEQLAETATKERKIVRVLLENEPQVDQDLSTVARQVVDRARGQYPDATFQVATPAEQWVSVSPRFDEAIYELLVNGVIHTDADRPTVTLSVTADDDAIEVTVTDNGPGIPDNETAILSAAGSLEPLFHGRGLGLWLVYWIAHFSGATLSFTDNDPQGSAVTIRLTEDDAGLKLLDPDDLS